MTIACNPDAAALPLVGSIPLFCALWDMDGIQLYNVRCEEMFDQLAASPAIILDPPFDAWDSTPIWPNKTVVCFTNWQNRWAVEKRYGRPRAELVWHFKDGRWVSHSLPRITHESILIYGPTGSAYVGEPHTDRTPRSKGKGCIGRDKMPDRIWTPKERRMLNSVLEYPRNVASAMGCWGKPVELMRDILGWLDCKEVADPYAGACSTAMAARQLGIRVTATESNAETCDRAIQRLSNREMALAQNSRKA